MNKSIDQSNTTVREIIDKLSEVQLEKLLTDAIFLSSSGLKFLSLRHHHPDPDKEGWYPTLHCWGESDKLDTGAAFWYATRARSYISGRFSTTLPLTHFIDKVFEEEKDAIQCADMVKEFDKLYGKKEFDKLYGKKEDWLDPLKS